MCFIRNDRRKKDYNNNIKDEIYPLERGDGMRREMDKMMKRKGERRKFV